jgi:hypothetical protein
MVCSRTSSFSPIEMLFCSMEKYLFILSVLFSKRWVKWHFLNFTHVSNRCCFMMAVLWTRRLLILLWSLQKYFLSIPNWNFPMIRQLKSLLIRICVWNFSFCMDSWWLLKESVFFSNWVFYILELFVVMFRTVVAKSRWIFPQEVLHNLN